MGNTGQAAMGEGLVGDHVGDIVGESAGAAMTRSDEVQGVCVSMPQGEGEAQEVGIGIDHDAAWEESVLLEQDGAHTVPHPSVDANLAYGAQESVSLNSPKTEEEAPNAAADTISAVVDTALEGEVPSGEGLPEDSGPTPPEKMEGPLLEDVTVRKEAGSIGWRSVPAESIHFDEIAEDTTPEQVVDSVDQAGEHGAPAKRSHAAKKKPADIDSGAAPALKRAKTEAQVYHELQSANAEQILPSSRAGSAGGNSKRISGAKKGAPKAPSCAGETLIEGHTPGLMAGSKPPLEAASAGQKKRAHPKKTQGGAEAAICEWEQAMSQLTNGARDDTEVSAANIVLEEAFEHTQAVLRYPFFQLLEYSGMSVPDLMQVGKQLQQLLGDLVKGSDVGGKDREAAVRCLCSSVCTVRLLAAHGVKASIKTSLLGNSMEILSKIVRVSVEDGDEERVGKKGRRPNYDDPITSMVEDCLATVPDIMASGGGCDDGVIFKITRAAMDGLASVSSPLQVSGIKILQTVSRLYTNHRANVMTELFHLGIDEEHDAKLVKKERSVLLEGCARPIPALYAAVISVLQDIPSADMGEKSEAASLDGPLKRCVLLFIALLEERFSSRSQQKSSVKDTSSKAFVVGLADALFSVLNLPCFPVAEIILTHLVDRLDHMVHGKGQGKISDFYRGLSVELLCSTFLRLAKLRKASTSGALSCISPVSPVSLFDEVPSSGLDAIASAKSSARSAAGPVEDLLASQQDEYARQYAGSDSAETFQSPIKRAKHSRDHHQLLNEQLRQLVLNHLCSQQGFAEGSLSHSAFLFHVSMWCSEQYGGDEPTSSSSDFWQAQSTFVRQGQRSSQTPLIAAEYIEAACLRLATDRPLMSKLGARLNSLVSAVQDARPADRVKALKTMNEAAGVDSSLVLRSSIVIVRDEFIFDTENANVRAAAVDLLSASILQRMKAGGDVSADFAMLRDRSVDASLSVRLSVLSFLSGVCKLERERSDVEANSSSDFILNACSRVSQMAGHTEESLQKGVFAFFRSLWFQADDGMRLAPLANRIDELLMVVERWNDDPAPERLAWLVQAMSTVDESALEQCAAALAERIMIIHNISPVKRGKVIKPSEFNDFETRINRLIPVLRALSCISKAAPEVVAGHLQFVRPVLATNEMSPGHLYVLKLMLELIDTSLLHSKSVQTDIETDLCSAFSDGAFKLTDPKRFVAVDDMCQAVKCFATVVQHYQTPKPLELVANLMKQQINFLKVYIAKPDDKLVAWVPRCLVLAGALMRYCDPAKLPSAAKELAEAARVQLFSICMSHYVNHRKDPVRRCAMHALGSICVRRPEVMLQEPCTKLFTKCLRSDSPPALRSQVLRNLIDHFNQEEALVADSASLSTEVGQSASKVESDRSALLVHAFHRPMLEASLSDNTAVRQDAVALILVIMRRGLTATYLCLPYLFAQQRYPDSAAGRMAMEALADVHVKQTSQYTAQTMWDGVVKAHGLHYSAGDSTLPENAFGVAFSLLAGVGKDFENKAVRSLVQVSMSRLERISQDVGQFSAMDEESRREQLNFAGYITSFIAALPFVTIDGPLSIINRANIIANELGHRCIDLLREASESGESTGDGLRAEGTCLGFIVGLSVRMKEVYDIKPDKIRKYTDAPHVLDKSPTKGREDADVFQPRFLFGAAGTLVDKREFALLWRLLQKSMGSDVSPVGDEGGEAAGRTTAHFKAKKFGGKRSREAGSEAEGKAKKGTGHKQPRARRDDDGDEEFQAPELAEGASASKAETRQKRQAKAKPIPVEEHDSDDERSHIQGDKPEDEGPAKKKRKGGK